MLTNASHRARVQPGMLAAGPDLRNMPERGTSTEKHVHMAIDTTYTSDQALAQRSVPTGDHALHTPPKSTSQSDTPAHMSSTVSSHSLAN